MYSTQAYHNQQDMLKSPTSSSMKLGGTGKPTSPRHGGAGGDVTIEAISDIFLEYTFALYTTSWNISQPTVPTVPVLGLNNSSNNHHKNNISRVSSHSAGKLVKVLLTTSLQKLHGTRAGSVFAYQILARSLMENNDANENDDGAIGIYSTIGRLDFFASKYM